MSQRGLVGLEVLSSLGASPDYHTQTSRGTLCRLWVSSSRSFFLLYFDQVRRARPAETPVDRTLEAVSVPYTEVN